MDRYDFELYKKINGLENYERGLCECNTSYSKQILKKRYAEGKQNELFRKQPEFSRSVVRYIILTIKGTENLFPFKK